MGHMKKNFAKMSDNVSKIAMMWRTEEDNLCCCQNVCSCTRAENNRHLPISLICAKIHICRWYFSFALHNGKIQLIFIYFLSKKYTITFFFITAIILEKLITIDLIVFFVVVVKIILVQKKAILCFYIMCFFKIMHGRIIKWLSI